MELPLEKQKKVSNRQRKIQKPTTLAISRKTEREEKKVDNIFSSNILLVNKMAKRACLAVGMLVLNKINHKSICFW